MFLSPGANAVETANQVKAFMEEAKKSFPPGIDYVIPYDSTMFVRAAIKDVVITLLEAIGLVILVVFIFLQNWRATLIPLLTVPVAVVGTFALFPAAGILDQHHQHVRTGAGDRHRGGRRDRGGGGGAAPHLTMGIAPARGHDSGHGTGFGAGGGDRVHSGRGVHSGGVSGRNQRPDLPAVRADHRGVGVDLGVQRAVVESGA